MGQVLVTIWTDYTRRAAVIAGMCVALGSLIVDCPVWVASARGACTIAGTMLLAHAVARLLAWSTAGDREEHRARLAAADPRNQLATSVSNKSGGPRD